MDFTQLLLIVAGLAVAIAGVIMLVRTAAADRRAEAQGKSVHPRPYIPLGVVAVGLIIAYHSFSDFGTFDPSDVTILFLFAVALVLLLGLRFIIVDKLDVPPMDNLDDRRPTTDDNREQ
jgi:O-antigen ligase